MAEGGPPRRARNLLSSYYGASVAPAEEVDDMNIDGGSFNADKYVSNLLQYKSLPELMQRGIAMVSEIKSLDSDMQMLVYENYNKFISATDTIRQMKNRVEAPGPLPCPARPPMHACSNPRVGPPAVRRRWSRRWNSSRPTWAPSPRWVATRTGHALARGRGPQRSRQGSGPERPRGPGVQASDSVNSSLSDRRGQLEGLNGVKKNLTKLQFLMDLPARLQAPASAHPRLRRTTRTTHAAHPPLAPPAAAVPPRRPPPGVRHRRGVRRGSGDAQAP